MANVSVSTVAFGGPQLLPVTFVDQGGGAYALQVSLGAGTAQTGSMIVDEMPASAVETDGVSAAFVTGEIMVAPNGTTPGVRVPVLYAFANVAQSQTDSVIVAASAANPAKHWRVLGFRLHAAATATNVTFNSKGAGAGTAISELFPCGINGGRGEQPVSLGHFQTAANEALTVTTGAGSTVGVGVVYCGVE